jgi:hypothetical protein
MPEMHRVVEDGRDVFKEAEGGPAESGQRRKMTDPTSDGDEELVGHV